MTLRSLNVFAVGLVLTGLTVLGISVPAQAATLSAPTATSTAIVGTSGTNATPITVTATAITGGSADKFTVDLPQGWSFVAADSVKLDGTCPAGFTTTVTPISMCQSVASSFVVVQLTSGSYFSAGAVAAVTFASNSVNVGSARDFPVNFAGAGGAGVDGGMATLAGGVTNHTVTFNANGGTGTVAAQTAATTTALTTNAFAKDGNTFNGWNTAVDGTGTAYADSASYAFASDVTLFAQWKPTLANTGFEGAPYFAMGATLTLAGAVIVLYTRRRQAI